jgi:tetratricopeptide (TPR) repeat protein
MKYTRAVIVLLSILSLDGAGVHAQSRQSETQYNYHYTAGIRDIRTGNREDAILEFTQAIGAKPDANAYAMRGITNAMLHKYASAISDFDRAISLNPDVDIVFYFDRAEAELNADLPDKARADLEIVIAKAGRNLPLLRGAYSLEKRYTEALKIDDTLVSQDQTNPWNWDGRCLSRAMVGNPEEALPDCDHAISLRSDAANLYVDRGAVRLKAGRLTDALSDFDQALHLDPKSSEAMFGAGTVETKLGNARDGSARIAEAKRDNAHIENDVPLSPW